jgi:hypothetical protein
MLILNYRAAAVHERSRALWVVAGFTVALVIVLVTAGFAVFGLLPDSPQAIAFLLIVLPSLAPLALVLSLMVAVFYTGAFDPRLVIRRTTAWGACGLLLTGLFALVENVISATISRWLHLPENVGTMVASMAVALAFVSLQKYVFPRLSRRTINRAV